MMDCMGGADPSAARVRCPSCHLGELLFSSVLESGDLLHVPRGFVHHAASEPDSSSLHYTISATKNMEWCEFLEAYVCDQFAPLCTRARPPAGFLAFSHTGCSCGSSDGCWPWGDLLALHTLSSYVRFGACLVLLSGPQCCCCCCCCHSCRVC
jgi:hypothetical protein